MTALYKDTKDSQYLNNNFVKKSSAPTTRDCKGKKSFNVLTDNNKIRRNISATAKHLLLIIKAKNLITGTVKQLSNHVNYSEDTIIRSLKILEHEKDLVLEKISTKKGFYYRYRLTSIHEITGSFTQTNNLIVEDENLSVKENDILNQLLSHAPSFIKNLDENREDGFIGWFADDLNISRSTLNKHITRISKHHYIKRKIIRDETGKFVRTTIEILEKSLPYKRVEKPVDNNNLIERKNSAVDVLPTYNNTNPIGLEISTEKKTELKNVFKELRKELGEAIYQNNLSKCTFEIQKNELKITTPTPFVENKLKNYHRGEILRAFKQHFNILFELSWEVDKDCIPNKELLVEDKTSNIQSSVVVLDNKRKENNSIRRDWNEWLAILNTNYGHDIIDSIEAEIFKKRPQLQSSTTMLRFSFIENQIKLMSIKFPNQNKMTPDMFIGAVSAFIAKEQGNIAEMSKNNHCPRVVANC